MKQSNNRQVLLLAGRQFSGDLPPCGVARNKPAQTGAYIQTPCYYICAVTPFCGTVKKFVLKFPINHKKGVLR